MSSKLRGLFWIGICLLFVPYLGIPNSWKVIIAIVFGVMIITISLRIRREYKVLRFKLRKLEQPTVETVIHTQEIAHE